MPPIKVKTLEGKDFYLPELRGTKTLVYVWSRTCAGHSRDLKLLNSIQEKGTYKVVSYAVAMEPKDVMASYQELGIKPKFLTLVDTEVRFNEYFSITFLPSTYLFDQKGRLTGSYAGLPEELTR